MMIEAVAAVLGLTSTGHQAVGNGIVVTIVKDGLEECLELEVSKPWRHKPKLIYFPCSCEGIQGIKRAVYVTTGSVCPSPGWATV